MAVPVLRDISVFGVEAEVTEGTYVAPSSVNSYFAPNEDGFEFTPQRELLDRPVMNSSIGASTPKVGMKGVVGSASCEFRASGTEGGDVDFGLLLKSAFGATRAIASTTTTKSSGNTGQVLAIEDADISKFAVGDIVCVKETGEHVVSPITAVVTTGGSATITLLRSKSSGNFSNSVVVSKVTMYYTANTGHPALSLSYYLGNTKRYAALGAKVATMQLDGFETGKLANLVFGWEGLTYTLADGTAPHTPAFDSGTPPVILNATVYRNGTALQLNNFTLNLENTLSYLTDTASPNGKVKSRVSERKVTGTMNPYMDDTTTTFFDNFDANTEFSIFVVAFIPSGTSGEITMGSIVGIYLPKCVLTEYKPGDADGLFTEELTFQAVRGAAGDTEEAYLGLI